MKKLIGYFGLTGAVAGCGLIALFCGCALLGLEGGPEVKVSPSSRKGEWHGYLNEAQAALGMKLKADSTARFVAATDYPGGLAAIRMPTDGRLVGGWTSGSRKGATSVLATYGEGGRIGPRTGLHEAARAILFTHGIHGAEQERLMKEKGVW